MKRRVGWADGGWWWGGGDDNEKSLCRVGSVYGGGVDRGGGGGGSCAGLLSALAIFLPVAAQRLPHLLAAPPSPVEHVV